MDDPTKQENQGYVLERAQSQQRALKRAQQAAAAGDPKGMVKALHASRALDGLVRTMRGKWDALSADEVDDAVAEAVLCLYEKVNRGETVFSPASYLFKVADGKAYDRHRAMKDEVPMDMVLPAHSPGGQDSRVDSTEELRAKALAIARSLLPRLGQVNIQRVMAYIFDAVEEGVDDLPNQNIAEALGLTPDVVRQSKSRGFRRLERLAREEGLAAGFDFVDRESSRGRTLREDSDE